MATHGLVDRLERAREGSAGEDDDGMRDTARSRAIAHFIVYWVFLGFIFAAVFAPPYTTHFYRQTATVKEPLLQTEIYPNVFFADAMNADQMYAVLERLFLPHAFKNKYYSGRMFSPDDKEFRYRSQYTAMALLAVGRVRLRQLRVSLRTCEPPRFLAARYRGLGDGGDGMRCFAGYDEATQDENDWTLTDPTTGVELELPFRAYSDGRPWESPFSKVWYGAGGQVFDLRLGRHASAEDIRALRRAGFVDNRTRAVFADMTWYNPNVDMFTNARLAFEFLPAGKMRPTLAVDSAPLLYDRQALCGDVGFGPYDRGAVLMEFALYAMSFWYLLRVTEDVTDYASLKAYLAVGWNCMDVVSVTCFVVALVLRTAWMLRVTMAQVNRYEEDIDAREWDDDTSLSFDTYVRMRLTFQYYRYCRNFLAAGVLVNFVKAFKFLSVSKQLSQFTETIYVVSAEMLNVVLILAIILVGFAIAFHVSLGHAVAGYRTFFDSMMTLTLAIFGDFDLEEIIAVAPTSGLAMMISYIVLMTFIILTMFLKIIDVSYGEVMDRINDGDADDFAQDLRRAIWRLAYDAYWSTQISWTLTVWKIIYSGRIA